MDEIADTVLDVLPCLLEMIGQAVQQGAFKVAMGGMYHQARLLVDDDDILVLVNDV